MTSGTDGGESIFFHPDRYARELLANPNRIVQLGPEPGYGGTELSAVSFPDSDGTLAPLLIISSLNNPNPVKEYYQANKIDIHPSLPSLEEKKRMITCIQDLCLPAQLALYLAIDSEGKNIDLDLYRLPRGEVQEYSPTLLLGLGGQSHSGKSMISALYSLQTGFPLVNFDVFSRRTSPVYLEALERKGFSSSYTTSQAFEIISKIGDGTPPSPPEDRTFRSALKNLLKLFEGGNRPPAIIIDFPGFTRPQGPDRGLGPFDIYLTQVVSYILPDCETSEANFIERVDSTLKYLHDNYQHHREVNFYVDQNIIRSLQLLDVR